ncbi:hypothetical protein ABZS61_18955 [Streptomyces sp. NPDC005566]|uniref:hypothetical protein n=1 Tax=Streptomyces sp. NPDC005566 TaxID=3156886 RepID=UPI0033A2E8BB
MGDMYAVDLALDLRASVPGTVMDDLRRHLGTHPDGQDCEPGDEPDDLVPLLAERGPAMRIGGLLVGEVARTGDGWSLTARQEVHAELLPDLDALLERLAHHCGTQGVIGQIRFYENHVPELLINDSGTLVRMALMPATNGDTPARPHG